MRPKAMPVASHNPVYGHEAAPLSRQELEAIPPVALAPLTEAPKPKKPRNRYARAMAGETMGRVMPHDAAIKEMRLKGMSQRQIAKALGMTRSNVQWRLLLIENREPDDDEMVEF